MKNDTTVPVAETIPAQKPPRPAPNVGVSIANVGISILASFSSVREILAKYPAPKRPYRTAPDERIWVEIDRTAPSRSDLERLLKHFRSQ